MNDEREEQSYTALFQQLPMEPAPPGLRDAVMARIARERVRRVPEAIVAAALALPSLLFLLWDLSFRSDVGAAVSGLFDALAAEAPGEPVFFVDGLMVLALAMVGLAGVLLTHALLLDGRARTELRPVSMPTR